MSAPTITCRYANTGRSAMCGAFTIEHHAHAAALGVCCVDAAFYDVDDHPPVGGAR